MSAPLILVTPEFGDKARIGMVQIRVGDGAPALMQPEQAILLASQIAAVAEQAKSETALMDFWTRNMRMEPEQARALLETYRLHRERLDKAHAHGRQEHP